MTTTAIDLATANVRHARAAMQTAINTRMAAKDAADAAIIRRPCGGTVMPILNTVEYTVWSPANRAHMQCQRILPHARRLTETGAQRIIRRDEPKAIVTRISVATYA